MFTPRGREYLAVWAALSAKAQSESREVIEEPKTPFERLWDLGQDVGTNNIRSVELREGTIRIQRVRGEGEPRGVNVTLVPRIEGEQYFEYCVPKDLAEGLCIIQYGRAIWRIVYGRNTHTWVDKGSRLQIDGIFAEALAGFVERKVAEADSPVSSTA